MFKPLKKDAPELETKSLERVFGLYRFQVGAHEITVINDGFIGILLSFLAVNAPEEDLLTLMQEHGLGTEFARVPIGVVLVRTGERLVLLDTGSGTSDFARELFGDYTGGNLYGGIFHFRHLFRLESPEAQGYDRRSRACRRNRHG